MLRDTPLLNVVKTILNFVIANEKKHRENFNAAWTVDVLKNRVELCFRSGTNHTVILQIQTSCQINIDTGVRVCSATNPN